MAEVWELIKQALGQFYEVVVAWASELPLDPRGWDNRTRLVVLSVVLVVIVWQLLRRRSNLSSRRSGWPQFLVTNGSITLLAAGPGSVPAASTGVHASTSAPADGGRRKPAALTAPAEGHYQLKMTINNLNPFAVQLLELAVQTGAGAVPVIADAAAVLPPHGAVDVVVDLFDLPGDRGTVALYLHNSASRPRSLRLTAPLEWEPWNQRYRVKGTALRLEQAGAPASEQYRRRRIGQLRRQKARSAIGAAAGSLWQRLTGALRELKASRARAAAAASAARVARSAATQRESPIAVPLAPSRSTAAGDGQATRPTERVGWPDAAADRQDSPAAEQTQPGHEGPQQERPRLDFPDEF